MRYTNVLAKIFDWFGETFEHLGPALFRMLSQTLPYLSPIPVAWLTAHSATTFLQFPLPVSVVLVVVLEGLGVWVTTELVDSVVVFVRSRNTKTFLIVLMLGVVIAAYIAVLISLNVSLEQAVGNAQPIYSLILTLICFLPLISGTMNGYRKVKLDTKTEMEKAAEREAEFAERRYQEARQDRKERYAIKHGLVPHQVYNADTAGAGYRRGDWRTLTDDEKRKVIEVLSVGEIMQKYSVSRSTAFAWKSKRV